MLFVDGVVTTLTVTTAGEPPDGIQIGAVATEIG
jgi:hypothetical protein